MKISKIEHIAINTRDFTKSADFYERILGFIRIETIECDGFDITYFELPGGARLELFDYHGTNPDKGIGETDVGLRHLAFEVEDVASHEKELRDKGVNITLPTCNLDNLGVRVLLFTDPNGITIEFCEKL